MLKLAKDNTYKRSIYMIFDHTIILPVAIQFTSVGVLKKKCTTKANHPSNIKKSSNSNICSILPAHMWI